MFKPASVVEASWASCRATELSPAAVALPDAWMRDGLVVKVGLTEMEEKYSAQLKYVAAHPFIQLAVGRGKDDMLMAKNSDATLKLFDKYGIKYRYTELNGAHSFVFSRRYLAMVFPMAFQ